MVERDKCCGCGACFSICSQSCIEMIEDKLGFLYPQIDVNKCIHCNLCSKVCPSLVQKKDEDFDIQVYGGYALDEIIRKTSSSGGIFSLIANYILNRGGIVVGASFDNEFKSVNHKKISKKEDLYKLKGSKYVQSKTYNIFSLIKKALLENKEVLFSGTPCQIDGLNLFLGKEYSNLLCVEVICHGTPAPKLFYKYINEISHVLNDKVVNVSFRDEYGGNTSVMSIDSAKGYSYKKNQEKDPYYRMFLSNTCLRESCYQCPSKGLKVRADITLGDFWGGEKIVPELYDGGGVSLIILHNGKGKEIFKEIKSEIKFKKVEYNDAIKGNKAFNFSYKKPYKRNTIESDLDNLSMNQLARKYTYSPKEIIKFFLHMFRTRTI